MISTTLEGHQHQHKERNISSCLYSVSLTITAICFVLQLAVMGGVIALYKQHNSASSSLQSSSSSCIISCDSNNPQNTKHCCVYNGNQMVSSLDSLFKKYLSTLKQTGRLSVQKKTYIGPNNASDYMTSRKPAGHVVGSSSTRRSSTTYNRHALRMCTWSSEHHLAFLKNGIDFRSDRLIVSQSGTYFVYSQVHLVHHEYYMRKTNQSPKIEPFHGKNSVPISHYLYRYNIMYPNANEEKLLESFNTKNCNRSFQFSSYLGANLFLRAGDELFVKIRGVGYVPYRPQSNSFGLYLL